MYIHYLYKFRPSESRFNTFTDSRPGDASQAPSKDWCAVRRDCSWPLARLWPASLMLHENTIIDSSAIKYSLISFASWRKNNRCQKCGLVLQIQETVTHLQKQFQQLLLHYDSFRSFKLRNMALWCCDLTFDQSVECDVMSCEI